MNIPRSRFLVAAATVGVLATSISAFGGANIKVGSKAPEFKASLANGSSSTLKDQLKKGPVTLYFIKIGCRVNHVAAPFFKKIDDTYKGKSNIVGIINGSTSDAKDWAKQYKAGFPVLADPDLKIIRSYGAEYSPWAVTVGTDGKVTNILNSNWANKFKVVNQTAASAAKAKLAALHFDGAPSEGG